MEDVKDPLGDRMKGFENETRNYLTPKVPVIMRLDGKAFHSLTRGLYKPYDVLFMDYMDEVAVDLCTYIQGCKYGYVQSDEISLLLLDIDKEDTQGWFAYNIQKMVSVAAAKASVLFNEAISGDTRLEDKEALFDARVFNLPEFEVDNYFLWRRRDCKRNSISMLAQAHFSSKQLHGLNSDQMLNLLWEEKQISWGDQPFRFRHGASIVRSPEQSEEMTHSWTDKKTGVLCSKTANVVRRKWCIEQKTISPWEDGVWH